MQTHDVFRNLYLCWWTVYIFGNEFIKTVFFEMFSTKFPTLQVEGSIAVSSQGAFYMGLYEGFSNVTIALCKWFMIFFSPDFLLPNRKKTGYFIPSEINLHTLCMYHLNPNGYDFLGMRIWRPDELNSQVLPLGCHDIIRRSWMNTHHFSKNQKPSGEDMCVSSLFPHTTP